MTLSVDEFIRRFLLHVLPKGFHRIRYYGFFANTVRRDGLARARAALNVTPTDPLAIDEGSHAGGNKHSLNAGFPCPHCGTPMILFGAVITQASARGPPRAAVAL